MRPTALGHAGTSAGHCVSCAQVVSAISSWIAPRETPLSLFSAGEPGRLRPGKMTVLSIMKWQPPRWKLLNSSWEAPTDCKCNRDWNRLATQKWLRVTILFHTGTEAVRYCFVEGNATSSNGLTWARPSAYHGCNPSPPSLLPCKAPASLALVLDSYFQHALWASIRISQVSHSQVPNGEPTSLLNQTFSRVPPGAHQRHWYHTVAQRVPSPVHFVPPLWLLWRKRAPVLQNTYLLLKLLAGTAKKLYLVSCASVTRFARHDIGNGQETSTLRIAAILPLPSTPRLSSTPTPDLALFSAAFLTQTLESDLEPKTNKKPNTLPMFFYEKGWHPVSYLFVLKSKTNCAFLTALIL